MESLSSFIGFDTVAHVDVHLAQGSEGSLWQVSTYTHFAQQHLRAQRLHHSLVFAQDPSQHKDGTKGGNKFCNTTATWLQVVVQPPTHKS